MYSHAGQAGPSKTINQTELSYGLGCGDEEDVSAQCGTRSQRKEWEVEEAKVPHKAIGASTVDKTDTSSRTSAS